MKRRSQPKVKRIKKISYADKIRARHERELELDTETDLRNSVELKRPH